MAMNPRLLRPLARQAGALPPATDPDFANVSLLLHMDGANESTTFTDSSSFAHAMTASGNAAISTAQSKFGGASAYFDGDGDLVSASYDDEFDFGTGDFTIEAWVFFPTDTQTTDRPLVAGGGYPDGWACYAHSGGYMTFAANTGSWGGVYLGPAPSENAWHHIAIVRHSGVLYAYTDGVETGSSEDMSGPIVSAESSLTVGSDGGGTMLGYVDEFRITKGVARYTGTFTPPSAPFPNQ